MMFIITSELGCALGCIERAKRLSSSMKMERREPKNLRCPADRRPKEPLGVPPSPACSTNITTDLAAAQAPVSSSSGNLSKGLASSGQASAVVRRPLCSRVPWSAPGMLARRAQSDWQPEDREAAVTEATSHRLPNGLFVQLLSTWKLRCGRGRIRRRHAYLGRYASNPLILSASSAVAGL